MGGSTMSIDLQGLSLGMPGLNAAWGEILAQAAAVCLEKQNHAPGATLYLQGLSNQEFSVDWPSVDDQCRRSHNDIQEATEHGACGVAILMVKEVTGLVVLERSAKGPGFDYWLGKHADNELFANKSRLEVSGILSGPQTAITSRMRQKKDQIARSDELGPGYVAIIEFSKPVATIELK